jgi:DNA-directed RNA polymerase alpha subunit
VHHLLTAIGSALSSGWGIESESDQGNLIKSMSETKQLMCVMTAVVQELRQLQEQIRIQLENKPVVDESDPSDGMLEAFHFATAGRMLSENLNEYGLSVRARKVLRRSGLKFISEITAERLAEVRQCGATTCAELLEFKARLSS